ncbi:putative amidohydrolase [Rhodococcoides trifolii]|uniref:Amidohydrolase n=1 Tax=Rhodococcoides trifolii TaxID=908250 RepID=A0A917FP28_9NOCA|nr:guanine deaminase [Rhodococcus trifolii]GGF96866.1 putative amidohydrolase [Rhodococcus trifolii]
MNTETARVHRGHVFHIAGSPVLGDAAESLVEFEDGALVVASGKILWCGNHADLPAEYLEMSVDDHRPGFLIPGFVDTHVHFPQTFTGDAYGGGQLLEWLERCVFPSEARFSDLDFASVAAARFCDRRIAAGTTAAMVFGSAFPHAQDALFTETARRGLRIVSGRGIQTRGPASAAPLITSEADAIRLTREEIEKWHGDADSLLHVAVVPRFSLSVTTDTFAALGDLYDDVRTDGVYFHSHLNENDRPGTGEVAATKEVFGTHTYLDTYDGKFLAGSKTGGSSLLGRRSILAHAVHCEDGELARMAETGTSISHCPTSQQFLGSGTMPWKRTVASGVTVSMGSDHGGGDEFCIARVLNDSFKVHISEPGDDGLSLHPAELLFSGTLAGARALDMEERFGNFDVGKDADFLVIDPSLWEPLHDALAYGHFSDDPTLARDQRLFTLLMTMREPAIAHVHVRGRRL